VIIKKFEKQDHNQQVFNLQLKSFRTLLDVQAATNFQNYGCENAAECHEIHCPAPSRAIEFKDGHRLTLMINFEVDKELFYEVRNHSRIFTRMDLNIQEEDFKYGFGANEIQKTIT